ncbi:MAG: hypothetical protein WEB89_10595 [Balneolales bacterium]
MIYILSRSGLLFLGMIILLSTSLWGGCSRNEEQDQFEREAFRTSEGYTKTNSLGEIVGSEDPGDWRVSPIFEGYVNVHIRAHPNPVVIGDIVRIELELLGVDFINNLTVKTYTDNNFNFPQELYYYENSSQHGFINMSFDPILLSPSNVASEARGLHRVFIFDQNEDLITYGDIKVE